LFFELFIGISNRFNVYLDLLKTFQLNNITHLTSQIQLIFIRKYDTLNM